MPPKVESIVKPRPKPSNESAPTAVGRSKPRPMQPARAPPSRPSSSVRLRGSTITIDKPRNLGQHSLTIVVQAPKNGTLLRSPRAQSTQTATRSSRGVSKSPARMPIDARINTKSPMPCTNFDSKLRPAPEARSTAVSKTPKSPVVKPRVDSGLRKELKTPVLKSVPISTEASPGILKESKVASAFAFWAAASKAGAVNPLAASRQKTEFECGKCGNVHDQRTAQCLACGADLEFQCWTCGMVWKKYVKYCSDCGAVMLLPLEVKHRPPPPIVSIPALSLPAPSDSFSHSVARLTSSHSLSFPSSTAPSIESSESSTTELPLSLPTLAVALSTTLSITLPTTPSTTPSATTSTTNLATTTISTTANTSELAVKATTITKASLDEEDDFGEVTEVESRQRSQTEAPIVAAVQRLADEKASDDKEDEEGGPQQLSLDLSQYSSVDEMVEQMLLSKHLAISFRNIFFNTLHLFSTPSYILDESIRVLSSPPLETEVEDAVVFVEWINSKLKGYSVIKNWLSQFPQDFDDAMRIRLVDWLSGGLPASGKPRGISEEAVAAELLKLTEARARCLTEARQSFVELSWIRKSIPVADPFTRFFTSLQCWPEVTKQLKEMGRRPLTLADKKPRELAVQLTLLQIKRMLMVPGQRAFLKGASKLTGAPSQMKISNSMSCWVACEVLKHNSRKDQALVVNHFVQIAKECYALRNFATVFEIVYGLNQNSVYRLRGDKATGGIFDKLSKQTRAHYDSLIQFANPSNNYGTYRKVIQEMLRGGQGDCWAPYLGVLLKDLVTIEEGGKPLKLTVRVEENDKEDKEEDETDDDPEVLVEIHGGVSGEEEKSREVVYVLFDKCREMSRNVSEVLACCHNYPIFPIAGAGGLLAAPGAEMEESRQTNLLGVNSKERRKAVSYDKLVPDEVIQLQLLEAILSAMTVEELDARSLEILPRKARS